MNYSLLNAGRTTHFKIVAVALVAAIAVVAVGVNARTFDQTTDHRTAVVKAGQPAALAGQQTFIIR